MSLLERYEKMGVNDWDIVALFIGLPVPATREQLIGEDDLLRYRIFQAGLHSGSIIEDGNGCRLSSEILELEIATTEGSLAKLQTLVSQLHALRVTSAAGTSRIDNGIESVLDASIEVLNLSARVLYTCLHCQHQFPIPSPDSHQFCEWCGKPIELQGVEYSQSFRCPICDHWHHPGIPFCPLTGRSITEKMEEIERLGEALAPLLEASIDVLNLSARSRHCVRRAFDNPDHGIESSTIVRQLVSNSARTLRMVRNFGPRSLWEVRQKLYALGLFLLGEDDRYIVSAVRYRSGYVGETLPLPNLKDAEGWGITKEEWIAWTGK